MKNILADSRLVNRLTRLSQLAAASVTLIGCIGMVGWLFDIALFRSLLPGISTMKFNTALAFAVCGLTLLSLKQQRRITQAIAIFLVLLGLLTLIEYLLDINLGIDNLIIQDSVTPLAHNPGRMSVTAAFSFVCIGMSLLLVRGKLKLLTQFLILLPAFLAFMALVGYIYEVESLYRGGSLTGIALLTTITFILICFALLGAYPEQGLVPLLTSASAGGFIARRLFPATLLIPVVGWLCWQGALRGWYDHIFGLALFAVVNVFIAAALIARLALTLHTTDQERWAALEALHRANDMLERRVQQSEAKFSKAFRASPAAITIATLPDGRWIEVNEALEKMTGYTSAEAIGRTSAELGLTDEAARARIIEAIRTQGAVRDVEIQILTKSKEIRDVLVSIEEIELDGKAHALSIQYDITDRKRAERRFRALLEAAPDAAIIVNANGEIALINVQTEVLFGYTRQELIGKPVEMLIPEPFRSRHPDHREAYQAIPRVRTMGAGQELYGLRRDGSQFPVEISLSPIETSEGILIASSIRDVTARKLAEAALQANEEKLQTIFSLLPVGASLINTDRQIVQMNLALQRILAMSMPELLQGNYRSRQYIHGDGTPMLPAEFPSERAVAEQQAVHDVEIGVIKEDGTTVWTSVSAAPLPHNHGVVVVTVDITERRQAEAALRRSESLYRTFARNFPGGVLLFGHDLRYILVDGTAIEELGLSKQLLEGRTLREVYSADIAEAGEPYWRATLAGETINREVPYKDQILALDYIPVRDEQDVIIAGMIMAQIITTRKQAEAALRESERQFRLVAENSPDVIYVLDLLGHHLIYLNRTDFLGYDHAEIEGSGSLTHALHPEDQARVMAHWQQVMVRGSGMMEYRLKDKAGAWQWIQSRETTFATGAEGKPTQLLVTLSVITERKHAEQQALELEKEREHVKILSDFIRDTSHDFRTPITSLSTSLYLLTRTTDPDKQQRHLSNAEQHIKRLTELIDRLLMMARLDGMIQLNLAPVALNRLVADYYERVSVEAGEKNIVVRQRLDATDLSVRANRFELMQALVELGHNALKYTPPHGTITLQTYQQDQHAVIELVDTGVGIPTADLPHIFQRLYRVDKARSTEMGGAGLGLSIAKRIVELHAGSLTVESTVGQGSVFRIVLPLIA